MPPEDDVPTPADGDATAVVGYVEPMEIQEEMERSFLEYSMSVIVSRALPDVRDGLKPVHRRILYSMYDENLRPDRPHVKSPWWWARSWRPTTRTATRPSTTPWPGWPRTSAMRHPLIDGHGNFGGPGPDEGPAAMRYTECRLAPLAMELMAGIDEETVDWAPNYSNDDDEPTVLPARFPNILVNGSQGIAVGMATNIPPHNLGEIVDATLHLLEHPEATPDDLMAFVKGPDFPTGGLILGRQGILDAIRTGRGSIRLRAVAEIEEERQGTRIVVTEIPYQTSVEVIAQKIVELVRSGELEGISDVQDDTAARQDPPGHQAEARRQRQRRAQQALQAHPAPDQLRGQHPGPGGRGPSDAEPGPGARSLRGPPAGRGDPAHRVPVAPGPGAPAHRRGPGPGH